MKKKYLSFYKIKFLFFNIIKNKNLTFETHNTQGNIYLKKYNAIYFFIPKVACSSIKSAFSKILGINIKKKRNKNCAFPSENIIHTLKFCYIQKKDFKNYNESFKFAFVRNPYDRLVSCYKNRIKKDPNFNLKPFTNGVYDGFLQLGNFYAGMSFSDFAKEIYKIDDNLAEDHFKSQHKFICDGVGKIFVDKIYKFENLAEDFKKLQEKIGVKNKIELQHLMKTKRKSYKDYYDEEIKKIVTERYKKDIELFNYKF